MKKPQIKYLIDVGMGLSFLICFLTGLMNWPTKAMGNNNFSFNITIIHDYAGLLIGFFVCIHLILNWKWIYVMTKKQIRLK